ncbi:putative beta-lysine N-acetyltransferase [Pseudalkalibacillus caeni]|uniref:Putative beta-lysine N-acetyltransferase n=1 Tax=Exobacillus caeni TaxID=2574798 RepID=A0A5R9F1H7_9BACL|nr:putative beta-lysine N-acetyltransferase [Pseudalkalibacillus caeni]TLS37492.1 putative beta-lysine N-acetyltransferase [Pseudalkalibacillus caeni]
MDTRKNQAVTTEKDGKDHWTNIAIDPFNERVRLDDYRGNIGSVIDRLEEISNDPSFSKIIIKARAEDCDFFISKGYQNEGKLANYFSGSDAYMMTKYKKDWRRASDYWVKEDDIFHDIIGKERNEGDSLLPEGYQIRKGLESDAEALASMYRSVFKIYPTPLNDPEYIRRAMKDDTLFYVCIFDDKLVSAASAEINPVYYNAEITDCATLKEHRKAGLMRVIIKRLEEELKGIQIYTAYSIARALSYGMNNVLYNLGYRYGGRMANNVKIYDKWEDMNLWNKKL